MLQPKQLLSSVIERPLNEEDLSGVTDLEGQLNIMKEYYGPFSKVVRAPWERFQSVNKIMHILKTNLCI